MLHFLPEFITINKFILDSGINIYNKFTITYILRKILRCGTNKSGILVSIFSQSFKYVYISYLKKHICFEIYIRILFKNTIPW